MECSPDCQELTESGLSVGLTRAPSKRNRTEEGAFPWRSQKAFMSFERAVVRLILKKTSLLLSVTLMFRCSLLGCSSGLPPAPGDCSRSDMMDGEIVSFCVVVYGSGSVEERRESCEGSVRDFMVTRL